MRAKEFITEQNSIGEPPVRAREASRGLHKFRDIEGMDRIYELNRVMMAVASADGIEKPVLDGESWAGKRNTAHPYTDVENKMLKHAYDAVGIPHNDLNNGDLESKELEDTNTISPIKPFKGY